MNPEYKRKENENYLDYAMRLIGIKKELRPTDLDWRDINDLLGLNYNSDSLRKSQDSQFGGYSVYQEMKKRILDTNQEDFKEEIITNLQKLKELKASISDERTSLNKLIKEKYRIEHMREIAYECVSKMDKIDIKPAIASRENAKEALLVTLSDFHYGLNINEFNNKYNEQIFFDRLKFLEEKIIEEILNNKNIKKVIILGMGDFIAGLIHNIIRIESRENVVEQVIKVSSSLINFISYISEYSNIDYYDCIGNHSRLFEDKKNCLSKDSFDILIHYILEKRFEDMERVNIHNYTVNEKIGEFEVFQKKYAFCHGDGFCIETLAKDLSTMTRNFYEAIFVGHIHHFYVEEQNGTLVISNGSLAGNDEFSNKLRKTSIPSQNIFILNENGIKEIKPIRFN